MNRRLASMIALFGAVLRAFAGLGRAGRNFSLLLALVPAHGSSVIGGQHALRIARALAQFDTTVVRLDDTKLLESLVRTGARKVIAAAEDVMEPILASYMLPFGIRETWFFPGQEFRSLAESRWQSHQSQHRQLDR